MMISGRAIFVKNNYIDYSTTLISAILLYELEIWFSLHVFKFFGNEFAIIFGVFNEVLPFLVILGIFIFIFASSLHILLKLNTNSGGSNGSWGLTDYIIIPYAILTGKLFF